MKKTISLLLVLLLVFGFLPAGARAADEAKTTLNLGETQAFDFVNFTLEKAELYKKIKIGTYYWSATEGKQCLFLSGSIENTHTSSYSLQNITGDFLIDDTYSFSLNAVIVEGTSMKSVADPFAKGTLYLFAELPDELAAKMTSAVVRFGFNDNFETKPEKLSDAKYSYQLTVSKEEGAAIPIDLHEFAPVKYKLKDTLKAESLKLTFSKSVVAKKVKMNISKNSFYYEEAGSGQKIVGLTGTVSNTGKAELQPEVAGYVLIDGVKYSMETRLINYKLPSKGKSMILLYAQIPNSVLKNNSSAEIYFGFDDSFTNGYGSEPEDCQFAYFCTVKLK